MPSEFTMMRPGRAGGSETGLGFAAAIVRRVVAGVVWGTDGVDATLVLAPEAQPYAAMLATHRDRQLDLPLPPSANRICRQQD
jgi:hypothetical protein